MALFTLFNKPEQGANRAQEAYHPDYDARHPGEDPNRPSQTAIIYQSELDYMSRFILDYPDIETGGQLFGFWTATGVPVVMYTIGPGRAAQHHRISFIQDQHYLQTVGRELHRRYRLQHIGEWHSHHQLGLAHPSNGDVDTMQYGVGKPGFPRLLLCIGNCTRTHTTVNAFNFHENMPRDYVRAAWDIVDMDSPYRRLADAELQRMLILPTTRRAAHGPIHSVRNTIRGSESLRVHWLIESADNVEIMKAFVAIVQSMFPGYVIKPEMLQSGEPQIAIKGADMSIKLPYGFPAKSPVLVNEAGTAHRDVTEAAWIIGEEPLTEIFMRWLAAQHASIAGQHV
jgi:hypothetical protein